MMSLTMTFDAAPSCDTPDRCRFAIDGPVQQETPWQALYNRQGQLVNLRKSMITVRCVTCGKTFEQEQRMSTPYAPPLPAVPPVTR